VATTSASPQQTLLKPKILVAASNGRHEDGQEEDSYQLLNMLKQSRETPPSINKEKLKFLPSIVKQAGLKRNEDFPAASFHN
jgi:hypothetical protein